MPVFPMQQRYVEVTGDHRVITFRKALSGIIHKVFAREAMMIASAVFAGTFVASPEGYAPCRVGRDQHHEPAGPPMAQEATQKKIACVARVDEISVGDKDPAAVPFQCSPIGKDAATKGFAEIGAEVKVVIAFDENQLRTCFAQAAQAFEQRQVGRKYRMFISQPELENVAQHHQTAQLPALLVQKVQQKPITVVAGIEKVGVGEKNIFHGFRLASPWAMPDAKQLMAIRNLWMSPVSYLIKKASDFPCLRKSSLRMEANKYASQRHNVRSDAEVGKRFVFE